MASSRASMRPFVRVHARWSRLAILLGLEVALIGLAALAGYSTWRERRLRDEGVVGEAELVAVANRGRRTDVLYRLRVGGRVHWRANVLGQGARWATVPREHVAEVRRSGRVPVRYLPDDPRVSLPIYSSRHRSSAQVALALGLFALCLPIGVLASRRRARREAEARGAAVHPLWHAVRGPRTF